MRVAQINVANVIGSTGRTAAELSRALRERGHQCLTLHSQGVVTSDSVRVGNFIDVKAHGLLARLTGYEGHGSVMTTHKVLALLQEFRPDVVRLGNLHANFVHIPMLLAYLAEADLATVVTLDDCWHFTGKCTHFDQVGCAKWKTSCGGCPQLRRDVPSWFFDRTEELRTQKARLYSSIRRLAVVGVSDWIASEARSSLLGTAQEVTRIYNWVDQEVFFDRGPDLRESLVGTNAPLILAVATKWNDSKGLWSALELAETLPSGYTMLLVGQIPNGISLPNNLRHISAVDDPVTLAQWYSAADVFVNFSKQESFGKVTAEALSCGTPVITNSLTANPELVGPGCGHVTDDPSITSLLSLIDQVIKRGRASYTEQCRAFAKENFGIAARVSDYEAVFRRLVAKGSA